MTKFKIGDKVDFVNDYGVLFTGFTITGVNTSMENIKYSFEPDDTPWVLKEERNLWPAGTYKLEDFSLDLNCGIKGRFIGHDDWGNRRYEIIDSNSTLQAVLLNDVLYSVSNYGEPIEPLENKFQIVETDIEERATSFYMAYEEAK